MSFRMKLPLHLNHASPRICKSVTTWQNVASTDWSSFMRSVHDVNVYGTPQFESIATTTLCSCPRINSVNGLWIHRHLYKYHHADSIHYLSIIMRDWIGSSRCKMSYFFVSWLEGKLEIVWRMKKSRGMTQLQVGSIINASSRRQCVHESADVDNPFVILPSLAVLHLKEHCRSVSTLVTCVEWTSR